MPSDVKQYIEENLGMFELIEEGDDKILIFELKINEIDFSGIHNAFTEYFEKNLEKFYFDLKYEMSQDLDSLFEQLKNNHRVPFMFHLLERSKISLKMDSFDKIFEALGNYLDSLKMPSFTQLFKMVSFLSKLKGTVKFDSLTKMDKKALEQLDWDQRGIIQEVFLAFDNPINNYIFSSGGSKEFFISGKILNILNYELKANLGDLQNFLKNIKTLG